MKTLITSLPVLCFLLCSSLALKGQTILYSNDFENTTVHPDWSGWGFTTPSVTGGSISSVGAYITPNFGGSRAWVVDGTLTSGTHAAGNWSISGSSPLLNFVNPNPASVLADLSLEFQLSPNIYTNQLVRVSIWDGVNFANRLQTANLFPGFKQNYNFSLADLTAFGTGFSPTATSAMITFQIVGENWTWNSADDYKAIYIDNLQISAIPEPTTVSAVIGLVAILGLVAFRRRLS
jgi:hypothetical protein